VVSLASTLGGLVVSGFDTRSAWASISSGQRHLERVRRRVMTTHVEAFADPSKRHLAAVRRSLGWAPESAAKPRPL